MAGRFPTTIVVFMHKIFQPAGLTPSVNSLVYAYEQKCKQ